MGRLLCDGKCARQAFATPDPEARRHQVANIGMPCSLSEQSLCRTQALALPRCPEPGCQGFATRTWRHLGGEHAGVVVDLARVDEDALRQLCDLLVKAWHERVHGLPPQEANNLAWPNQPTRPKYRCCTIFLVADLVFAQLLALFYKSLADPLFPRHSDVSSTNVFPSGHQSADAPASPGWCCRLGGE